MLKSEKEITVGKEKFMVELLEYETLEELMLDRSAVDILTIFNHRNLQLQAQEAKKRLKPRRIPLKEKRVHALNLFSEEELLKVNKDASIFEYIMKEKLIVIEEKIEKGEIV